MGNFSEGFFNIFIIVCTLGGLFAMYLLTTMNSKGGASGEGESTGHVWDEDLKELNNPLPRWWVNMFYLTIVFSVGYLILYPGLGSNGMLLGWTQITQYEDEMRAAEEKYAPIFNAYLEQDLATVAADPDARAIGERLYASYCTQCHGSDARGVTGFPNLRDDDWQWGGTPEAIEATILDGRVAAMPPWKDALGGDVGVTAMAEYIVKLGDTGADADGPAATQFKQFCIACHGPDGKGNPALGAPNLTDDVWLYGGTQAAVEETLTKGRNGVMPAHRDFLGEAKIHLLSAYVLGLSQAE